MGRRFFEVDCDNVRTMVLGNRSFHNV